MEKEIKIQDDGSTLVGIDLVKIPNVELQSVIDSGKNGVVIKGQNKFLDRNVAVKIWLKIKPDDKRDKFQQGIAEARKTEKSAGSNVVKIFDAGETNGYFYATMEYFTGITLKKWLKENSPKLAVRWHLSNHIVDTVCMMTDENTYHGDLHSNNILIQATETPPSKRTGREFSPQFKIIDFGTSIFSKIEHSIKRHWRVFHNTIAELLYPFDIRKLWGHKKPDDMWMHDSMYPLSISSWYHSFFEEIPYMLDFLGKGLFVTYVEPKHTYEDQVVKLLNSYLQDGKLPSDDNLGNFKEWWI